MPDSREDTIMEKLRKCEKCGVEYPSELLAPMLGTGIDHVMLCGICALQLSNEVLGVYREEFTGETAEAMRQKAIQWRKEKRLWPKHTRTS